MNKMIKMIGNMKLKNKFILIYFCVGFIPFLVLSMIFYVRIKGLIISEERTSAKDLLRHNIITLENDIKIYDNISQYLAFNQILSNTLIADQNDIYSVYNNLTYYIDPTFNSIKSFHNDINKITIYLDGQVVKHEDTLAPIEELYEMPWCKREDIGFENKWSVDEDKRIVYALMKMPLLYRQNIDGVLYLEVNYDYLFRTFNFADISNYSYLILDENNNPIFEKSKFTKDDENKEILPGQLIELAEKGDNNIVVDSSNELGWKVYLYKPSITASKKLYNISLQVVFMLILISLLTVIGLALASEFIVHRIERLAKNMKKVQSGELVLDITDKYNDEIGELIGDFGQMLDKINQLIQEVYLSKISQKEYELRALQQQINPHFLYNSLSMINFKAIEVGEEDISRITLALSSFYRTSLNKGKNYCTIRDEVNNIKAYMEIQLMMHDYNFKFICGISSDLYQYEILNLILQPIVENAIEHGLDKVEDDRQKFIKVTAKDDDEKIYISVVDSGIGMDEATKEKMLSENSHGYGMRNVNERIKLYFGEQYGIKIQSDNATFTKVLVIIPKKLYQV